MERAADDFTHPARSVKPNRRTYTHHPVLAVDGELTLSEAGELGRVGLAHELRKMPPTLFVTVNAADFVAQLDAIWHTLLPKEWQWRCATHERAIIRADGVRVAARVSVVTSYFGFKNGNYHKIIDPVSMYGHGLDKIWPGNESVLERLLKWGVTLRDFCEANGVEVRPTIGAIAAQFLRSPMFYPQPRRKVPAATNESVRERMPGNYYRLTVPPRPNQDFSAHYIDQHRAHHYAAATTTLPHSDHLYAYGRFTDLGGIVFDSASDDFYGLYCLDLTYHRKGTRALSWMRGFAPRHEKQFVYSNELPHLRDMGFEVIGVRAAWGSRHRDNGLAKYARWAMTQLDEHGNAPWLKPLLLSTYGVLATKPRYAESVFKQAKKGELVTLPTGRHTMQGLYVRGGKKLEPGIANVLHRGMIEAATRSESVGLAQYLSHLGHHVLSIYADAVIVKADDEQPLPPLPEPWRYKRRLNHLQFINQQAFMSGEMTKLPGVSAELRNRQLRVHAPRITPDSVEEIMEHEEFVNTLLTKNRN